MQTFLHYRWRVPSTLHRLHPRRIIPLLLLALCVTGAKAQKYQTYDPSTCYTKVLIDARIHDFKGNTKPMGFGTYNSETDVITQPQWKKENGSNRDLAIDYVAGLVAKACIEAAVYYQDFTWSKPWFKLVENYATDVNVKVPTTGASLDDLNAAKMYFALAELTKPGAKYANSTTYDRAISELQNAIKGLKAVNEKYSIRDGSTVNYYSEGNKTCILVDANNNKLSPATSGMNAIGGWYHKATYPNQMWCDSEYMGPALLAQLVAYATENTSAGIGTVTGTTEGDWKLIAKQFDITWNYLWNSKDQLLYHGFSATPTAIAAHTYTWATGTPETTGTNGTNTAYWGRAIGWYFLALVDVLENMPDNISDNSYISTQDNLKSKDANIKNRLKSYLADLAAGIWAQRKSDTNLWTNVINEAVDTEHSSYSTTKDAIQSNTKNYLEASASAIYIAAYIKAMRLGLLSTETYKSGIDAAYQSYINNFITTDNNIINTCASAGLGGGDVNITSAQTENKENGAKYRNGTAAYYTRGYDVTKVTTYQEGKPLGAFILASTEYERFMKDNYAPSFTDTNSEKPAARTITKGQSITLHAAAMAKPTATYQWYSYPATEAAAASYATRATPTGTEISGATSSDLTVSPQANTYYYCVATNTSGTAQTDAVLVTVNEASNEGSGSGSETTATFDWTSNGNTTTTPTTDDTSGITVSGTKRDKSGFLHVDKGSNLTITPPTGVTITKLVITYTADGKQIDDSNLSYDATNLQSTWTGSSTSAITFTHSSSASAAARIETIEVTYSNSSSPSTELKESDLKIKTESEYYYAGNAWTPAVNGTIDVSKLVSSSSKGAYSITTGTDVATISGTTITALKAGTFTLSQAADDTYKAGSIVITVRIGDNVTSDGTNKYSFTAQTTAVSDGMTITRDNITMTFGNDGFWSKPSTNGYTGGQVNPAVSNNIPTKGTFYKFNATTTGSLKVKVKLGHDGKGILRPLYVSENGTLVKAKKGDGTGTVLDPTNMPAASTSYEGIITFPVKANTDYYVYVPGSKLGFYNFTFEPATLYTVTFDAGTNGTCSPTSLIQESEGANITLPDATPNTGYTFDGWYTAETGGNEVTSPYKPERDITLFARYTKTSSGGGATSFSGVVYFTSTGTTTNENVVSASGNMKSNPGTITYNGESYSNALKFEQSTSVTLTLTAKSDVVLVFNPNNQGKTIIVDGTAYSIGTDGTITVSGLGSGTHTITRGSGESHFYAVDIQSAGASLTITTQPVSADYLQGATATALSVTASIVNGTTSDYEFSYQWYRNGTESTTGSTAIGDPTTEPSCIPTVTETGTKYYYCVVTATKGTEVLTATSDFAKVTVNGPTVTFTTQPQGAVYKKSASEKAAALTVAATTNFSGEVAYQWYSNTKGTTPNPDADTKIPNATSYNYIPSISEAGKTYYYCIASSTYENDSKVYTAKSDLVCVEVVTDLYSYNVQGTDKPQCNESRSIVDDSGNTLVKFTFGGWKWKNNKYLKPNADDIEANYITDEWFAPTTQDKVNALDGYEWAITGKNDAVQEDKTATKEMYGKTRYGWFESPTRNKDGVTTDSHPYTLPVRGAYMTFEPTQNGTLTIYLLQNGAWNSDKNNNIDIIPGEFRMHAFQITNQRGLVLAEFAPQYKITVNQKVMDGYSCSKYETDPKTYDKTSKDISNWEEFWALTYDERKAVHDNWSNGTNGSQTIIKLQDGSFLAIQKAIVKYEFHVTGNETYYVFSNFSKLGFSGATFKPDAAQPTDDTTFSGAKSLDETKPYTKITPTADGTIGETGLTNYTFTIDGKEVGKVSGVFIPQFKEITLKRTFKKDKWNTLSLPFNLTQSEVEEIFGHGTEILVFKDAITTNVTKLHIKFIYHEIQNILPSYPYLIKPTFKDAYGNAMKSKTESTDQTPIYTIDSDGNLTSFTVYCKAINPLLTPQKFTSEDGWYVAQGTPDYCTESLSEKPGFCKKYEAGDLFISDTNGTLYISKGASYGKGYRSYIEYTGTEPSASTKTLSLSFSGVEDGEGDGTTTEISVAELADDVIEAFGIKGVYNLNGQKVAETTRNLPAGIYVVNGRKVVVK